MKLTQWHKGTDKPVRDGVYQRSIGGYIAFSMFKNGEWMWNDIELIQASKEKRISNFQGLKWRGITKPK